IHGIRIDAHEVVQVVHHIVVTVEVLAGTDGVGTIGGLTHGGVGGIIVVDGDPEVGVHGAVVVPGHEGGHGAGSGQDGEGDGVGVLSAVTVGEADGDGGGTHIHQGHLAEGVHGGHIGVVAGPSALLHGGTGGL